MDQYSRTIHSSGIRPLNVEGVSSFPCHPGGTRLDSLDFFCVGVCRKHACPMLDHFWPVAGLGWPHTVSKSAGVLQAPSCKRLLKPSSSQQDAVKPLEV